MTQRPAQADLPLQFPEGVHLRMPQHLFDGSRAIGVEDLRRLYWDAASWWAGSEHNPLRRSPQRATRKPGQDIDAALSTFVLLGEEAYAARYAIEPDDARAGWITTRDGARKALAEKGVRIPKGDFTDKTLFGLVRRHGLSHRVFDVARQDYDAARRGGRGHLTEDEDRRVRRIAALMIGHKEVGPVFRQGLSEVSVFWRREEDPKTLLRARFARLKLKRMYSLVPIGDWKGRDVNGAIRRAIEDGDLEIERRLQAEAFDQLVRFVSEGKISGWSHDGGSSHVLAEEREALVSIANAGAPQWVWLFVQIPSDEIGRERAAVIEPRFHMPAGRIWDTGGAKIEAALEGYRDYRDRFSLQRAWSRVGELVELVDEDVRSRVKKEIG